MFLLRHAKPDDAETFFKLAKTVHFINLPPDREIIADKIARSRRCFQRAVGGGASGKPSKGAAKHADTGGGKGLGKDSPLFMFSLEELSTGNTLGTSSIIAKMGVPGAPNLSFELRKREFFSSDLQAGASHMTAKLHLDESGPTEIGGLILGPTFRRHPAKLGRQLSMIRFHYIGLHREWFSARILAEMMAPLSGLGGNLFWEFLGRRFINLNYVEADTFCQHSREFMLSLLPREEIYLTLLPPEARSMVGQVSRDTVPARRMLESIGFEYKNRIDPFDGGPHLEAKTDAIPVVRDTRRASLGGYCAASQARQTGLVSSETEEGEFRALYTVYNETASGDITLTREHAALLQVEKGASLGVTPMDLEYDPFTGKAIEAARPGKAPPKPGRAGAKTAKTGSERSARAGSKASGGRGGSGSSKTSGAGSGAGTGAGGGGGGSQAVSS